MIAACRACVGTIGTAGNVGAVHATRFSVRGRYCDEGGLLAGRSNGAAS